MFSSSPDDTETLPGTPSLEKHLFCLTLRTILNLSFLSLFQQLRKDFEDLPMASHLPTFHLPRKLPLPRSFLPLTTPLLIVPFSFHLSPVRTHLPHPHIPYSHHFCSYPYHSFAPSPTLHPSRFPSLPVPCYLSLDSRPFR